MTSFFANFAIGITYSYLWYGRRKEAGSRLSKELRQFCFLPFFYMSVILLRYGFQQDNFSALFSFGIFFSEAVAKAALFVVEEVGAIQMMINPSPVYLRHLRLVCQSRRKSTRLLVAASSKDRLRTLSSSVFSS